ncbi:MAG: DUF551 domain-containing protein [Moraxellaceae bacterium]
MRNEFGLDVDYFTRKLTRVLESVSSYKPDEMARELARLVVVADEKVLGEREFSRHTPPAAVAVLDGWRLVPVEPTQDVLEAIAYAKNQTRRGADAVMTKIELASIYDAMLAAAPAPAPAPAPVATEAVAQGGGGGDDAARQTAADLLACFMAWEPDVRVVGNVRAGDAADAIRALLASPSATGWVKCSERPPEAKGSYLVLHKAGGMSVASYKAHYGRMAFTSYDGWTGTDDLTDSVVAWQPLPPDTVNGGQE